MSYYINSKNIKNKFILKFEYVYFKFDFIIKKELLRSMRILKIKYMFKTNNKKYDKIKIEMCICKKTI